MPGLVDDVQSVGNHPVVVHGLPLRSQLAQVSLPQEVPELGRRTTTELNNDSPSGDAGTDDPSLGLAPIVVDRVFESLNEIAATAVSVLLVEQCFARTLSRGRLGLPLNCCEVGVHGIGR